MTGRVSRAHGTGPPGDYMLSISAEELERYRIAAAALREEEAEAWRLAGVRPGADVVDVGCGPGAFLPALAEEVGPDGSVLGIDSDPEAVAHAEAVATALAHPRVSVRSGRATDTGLAPASYDVAFLHAVLAHNGGAEQAIVDHVASLLRPGGAIVAVDVELTMHRIQPPVAPLVELYERYRELHARRGNDLAIGLRLGELMTGAGLEVLDFRGRLRLLPRRPGARGPAWAARAAMVADGVATDDDVRRWEAEFAELDAAPVQPTHVLAGFGAVGRRPGSS